MPHLEINIPCKEKVFLEKVIYYFFWLPGSSIPHKVAYDDLPSGFYIRE